MSTACNVGVECKAYLCAFQQMLYVVVWSPEQEADSTQVVLLGSTLQRCVLEFMAHILNRRTTFYQETHYLQSTSFSCVMQCGPTHLTQ